jgi:uncharacterized protein (DUF885 family)
MERSDADTSFERLAGAALDDLLERHPEAATDLGDHRFDDRLSDPRPEALEEERRTMSVHASALAAIDLSSLNPTNRVDAEILSVRLQELSFEFDELREHEWNPLLGNPGEGIYPLLAREFGPLPDRLRAVAGRLAQVPANLEAIRSNLGDMPRVHVETAIMQFGGTIGLIAGEVDAALEEAPEMRGEIETVRPAALTALEEHSDWLKGKLDGATRNPRIGEKLFAKKLGYSLDAASDADAILRRAEEDLERIQSEIAEVASRIAGEAPSAEGLVRRVLDRLADDALDDETVVPSATAAFEQAAEFTRSEQIASVLDDPVEIIEMPEIRRGVAVAYCDPPGPLETAPVPTFFAISPTPSDWPPERVASFYREYNAHLIHELAIHEGIPGHVLQTAHARRFRAPTTVRATFWSGSFAEGWAVYSESVMAAHGYRDDAYRMQQLKMQLRMVINAILDARVHAHDMSEEEAMRLMVERGYQEEGEAVGKWRRALLTSAQLSTYYVGFTEVSDLMRDLRAARSDLTEQQAHDLALSYGSPSPRHLRTLVLE